MAGPHELKPRSTCRPCRLGWHNGSDHLNGPPLKVEERTPEPEVESGAGRCPNCYKPWDTHPGWLVSKDANYVPLCYVNQFGAESTNGGI